MKKRVLTIVKPVLFLALGVVMLWKAQDILTPSWGSNSNKIVSLENGTIPDFDVVFLGTSHVQDGISPMKLYEEYGVRALNLGTSAQPMGGSYFLLEKAFENYNIETVFLDMSGMFIDETICSGTDLNGYWRYILDNLSFGAFKFRVAKDYAQYTWSDGMLSAMLPIISYHSNWASLTERNFCVTSNVHFDYDMGQDIFSMIVSAPAHFTEENIDYATNFINNFHSGRIIESENGVASMETIERSLSVTSISDTNLGYLTKIKELCDQHGSSLILFKIPTMRPPQWYKNAWTRIKSDLISQIAEQFEVEFWDLQFHVDSLLSLETDTLDGGYHLNALGAEKVSDYIGARIIAQHLAFRKTVPNYDKNLEIYQKVFRAIELQTTSDFYEYLHLLKENSVDRSVIIAAADDYTLGFSDEDASAMKDLGLSLILKGELRDSYIGVISSGETVYEALSDYELEHIIQVPGAELDIVSRNGWIQDPGCSIKVNGQEQAQPASGLSILVYDHETECVLDAVAVNINSDHSFTRNQAKSNGFLGVYESALCEKEGW